MKNPASASLAIRLHRTMRCLVLLLMTKVMLEILYQYQWYFPADFQSSFLIGKEAVFNGSYRVAFYAHIISGPATVALGAYLMFTGQRLRHALSNQRLHRISGRIQTTIILCFLVPSGLIMATQAYTGTVASVGFATHAVATGISAWLTASAAIRRHFASHRRWATRCFILLVAPLLLRIVSGGTVVLKIDSDATYQFTVWGCWLIPLAIQETYWLYAWSKHENSRPTNSCITINRNTVSSNHSSIHEP